MADCKHEFVYDWDCNETVCQKCCHVLTKEEKRYSLEYANALRRTEEAN